MEIPASALRQAEFFQKLSYSPVAVPARHYLFGLQVLDADRRVRTGVAGNRHLHRGNTDLNRFTDIVTTVIDGVGQGFSSTPPEPRVRPS